MLFTSAGFALLAALTFTGFYLVGWTRVVPSGLAQRAQSALLLFASLVFYSFGDPRLSILLVAMVATNALLASRLIRAETTEAQRRTIVRAGVTINLLALGFFKYALLVAELLLPARFEESASSIPLPIGISFYTFQGISLIVDAGRRNDDLASALGQARDKGVLNYFVAVALYISFFPQLIAGPIVKASSFLPQIGLHRIRDIRWETVVKSLVYGYFLKLVVADNLNEHTAALTQGEFGGLTKTDLLLLIFGYSCQIFADFAGYSLIAIGLGALFGYDLPVNFNRPYISRSITEFWRRWHISLSSFLREYLYIPLGGNRRGVGRTYLNLMIVMTLGGLWHGGDLNFAVWGFAHGSLLAVERALLGPNPTQVGSALVDGVRSLVVFVVVSLLWLFFVTPDFSGSWQFFETLVQARIGLNPFGGGLPRQTVYGLLLFSVPVIGYHLWAFGFERSRASSVAPQPIGRTSVLRYAELGFLGLLVFLVSTNSGVSGDFIYFQF